MYQFHPLTETSLAQLAECFNLAFSDYEQSIHFTPESFQYYLTASSVDLSLSFGAFLDGVLVGIILNSSGIYKGEPVVFDAGTGIIPAHRGKKVFTGLFHYTAQQLRQRNIAKYYLEVLQSNHHAVGIYQKNGFSVQREYAVLLASGSRSDWNDPTSVTAYPEFTPFPTNFSVEPSFEHTTHNIRNNPQLYEVCYLDDRAYCIYAKKNGELIQMHYNDLSTLKEVVSAVIGKYPRAMAKNIDYRYADVIQVLKEIGFVAFLEQYEMVRAL